MKKITIEHLLASKTLDKDKARREYILNILLLGSIFLSFIATLISWDVTFSDKQLIRFSSIEITLIFFLFCAGYLWSRLGNVKLVSYIFIGFYLLITIYSSFRWGAEIPNGLLSYALIIIMAGILINSRIAFFVSGLISFIIVALIYFQSSHIISDVSNWRQQPETIANGVGYGITLLIIAMVSWLFNSESEKALIRARRSEMALKRQKDRLEILVEKRTKELRKLQIEKMAQVYRFAEMGRMTSGLIHELITPLSVISLNLEKIKKEGTLKRETLKDFNEPLESALSSTRLLGDFVQAARKQLQNQQIVKTFSIVTEINYALKIISGKANQRGILIDFTDFADVNVTGNPIQFIQVMTNLLLNAIDAQEDIKRRKKLIKITCQKKVTKALITVTDWGKGIKPSNLKKIFEPLFTTKRLETGMGMGLYLTKRIVEEGFHGSITVASDKKTGTTFTIALPLKNNIK